MFFLPLIAPFLLDISFHEGGNYKLLKGQREIISTRQREALATRQEYYIRNLLYYERDTLFGTLRSTVPIQGSDSPCKLCHTATHERFLHLTSCYVDEICITFPDLAYNVFRFHCQQVIFQIFNSSQQILHRYALHGCITTVFWESKTELLLDWFYWGGLNLKFCKKNIIFVLRSFVTVSSKLVSLKRVIVLPLTKRCSEKDLSSRVRVLRNEHRTFPCCRGFALKRVLHFLHQI